ncbi:MAG: LexA family protein [Ktedonobacteraceae bacterium]
MMNDNASVFRDVHFLPWPAHAGFPSPADDYKERPLDLNGLVVPHPVSTYFMRVEGDSMINTCIYSGDVIVVDRAITVTHNKIIVARLGEDFTVKRLQVIKGSKRLFLKPENPKYQLMEVTHRDDFEIWGCVTWVVHKLNSTR